MIDIPRDAFHNFIQNIDPDNMVESGYNTYNYPGRSKLYIELWSFFRIGGMHLLRTVDYTTFHMRTINSEFSLTRTQIYDLFSKVTKEEIDFRIEQMRLETL